MPELSEAMQREHAPESRTCEFKLYGPSVKMEKKI